MDCWKIDLFIGEFAKILSLLVPFPKINTDVGFEVNVWRILEQR